jgi:hypothetical protein
VVLSEVAYYLTDSGIEAIARNVHRTLALGGHVVAVHYRKETDYPLSGDDASAALARHLADCERLATFMEPSFRIDVFERRT